MWGAWARDPEALTTIGKALRTGRLVKIRSALQSDVAAAVHSELIAEGRDKWSVDDHHAPHSGNRNSNSNVPMRQRRKHALSCVVEEGAHDHPHSTGPPCPARVGEVQRQLQQGLDFWSRLALVRLQAWEGGGEGGGEGAAQVAASWYVRRPLPEGVCHLCVCAGRV